MSAESRSSAGAVRAILGGALGVIVEAVAVGLAVVTALAVAALVLWVV